MPRALEEGKPAKYKYNLVTYGHVGAKAAEQRSLTSDPWSLIQRTLSAERGRRRGAARLNLERAIYFADLAEDFYRTAQLSQLPTQATLAYYAMLNLVKAFISARGVELEARVEHHGLSLEQGSKGRIKVHGPTTNMVNIFAEFSKALGKPVPHQSVLTFEDLTSHIPELHALHVSLGYSSKHKLLPVDIFFMVNQAMTHLFTELRYDKKHDALLDTQHFSTGQRGTFFRDGVPQDGWVTYRSKKRRSFHKETIHRAYAAFIKEHEKFDLVSILTRSGYRYYADLKPGGLHHLAYALAAQFYVGAAARYRPLEINSVLDGPLRPLVAELLTVTPKQFLYHMACLITGRLCLIPYSNI